MLLPSGVVLSAGVRCVTAHLAWSRLGYALHARRTRHFEGTPVATLQKLVELFLHLDVYLSSAATQYGVWIYAILFAVIFMETGFVVTPLLPGDSLLLTAGVLAAQVDPATGGPVLNFAVLWVICVVAAVAGDSTNYWIGRLAGAKLIKSGRFVKREYVDRTEAFFAKHGGKTVTIARFFVIVRTFAPFMAGVGGMHYPRFLAFSVSGTLLWVTTFSGVGYLFGGVPFVRNNLEYGVMLILAASLIPGIWHWIGSRREAAAAQRAESAE